MLANKFSETSSGAHATSRPLTILPGLTYIVSLRSHLPEPMSECFKSDVYAVSIAGNVQVLMSHHGQTRQVDNVVVVLTF